MFALKLCAKALFVAVLWSMLSAKAQELTAAWSPELLVSTLVLITVLCALIFEHWTRDDVRDEINRAFPLTPPSSEPSSPSNAATSAQSRLP
jgi:hypothetical protein